MQENIEKWVEALRSGNYKQATGQLKVEGEYGDKYCCLGVACEISGFSYNPDGAFLPTPVVEWLGVESGDPYLVSESNAATVLNDDQEYTFEEIADAIEESYL